ncbi:RluA family pseudouridine synthase [Helicobacter sp. UBA3407]|uniref:RluA family pseudouridine synthase n=2 Tax=Helicobacteraceae TaxID=72293 RepID=UPI002603A9B0|nr:RluA family pseudouridine synthase [Helicobacter sp. UBA3407]
MKKKLHLAFAYDSSSVFLNQNSACKDSNPQQKQDFISHQTFTPNADEIGIRADIFLAKTLQISRSQVEKLCANKQILLNGSPLNKLGIFLKAQDILILQEIAKPLSDSANSQTFEIPILYQDEELLILNKPAGLIVHRANAQDEQYTLVDWLRQKKFSLSNLGDSYRAGIVHRLDKGTSGAIVIAKTNFAHEHLKSQLQSRQMGRYYLCVIDQALKESQMVDSPLIRHSKNRLKYTTANKNNPNAKSAKTAFFKISSAQNEKLHYELIGAKLFSGRTHQIRAHLSSLNRHILGDYFYGYSGDSHFNGFLEDRILLHSHLLYLNHPTNGKILHFYAPLFKDMQDFLKTYFSLESYQDSSNNLLFPLESLYHSTFFMDSIV